MGIRITVVLLAGGLLHARPSQAEEAPPAELSATEVAIADDPTGLPQGEPAPSHLGVDPAPDLAPPIMWGRHVLFVNFGGNVTITQGIDDAMQSKPVMDSPCRDGAWVV